MLGSTFVLGLTSGSKTLPLIDQSQPNVAEYYLRDSLKSYHVFVRHSNVNRTNSSGVQLQYDRHNVEATVTTFATSTTPESYNKAYFVIELLPGDTYVDVMDALSDWAIASTNANLVKLLGWES